MIKDLCEGYANALKATKYEKWPAYWRSLLNTPYSLWA